MRWLLPIIWTISISTALAQPPEDNPLFNCFKQRADKDGGTCVAFIKAAIGTLGVNNVLRWVTADNARQQYHVTLRNGEKLTLTFAQLKEATAACAFDTKDGDAFAAEIGKYARLCYAVMAKKLQLQNNYSYTQALAHLNDGYPLPGIATLLGVQLRRLKPCTIDHLAGYNHIIVQNYYYSAYANTGYYDEVRLPGGIARLADFRQQHFGPRCTFRLCNISTAWRIAEFDW